MPGGVTGFQATRLTQAREARELTAVTLAELVGVSPATISQYENDHQKPRQDTLDRLATILNVPVEFFLREVPIAKPSKLFYRSMSSATKSARARAEARYEWLLEVVDYLLEFFDFPPLNLPSLDVPDDFRKINDFAIECWAREVRQHWRLGGGPVPNVVKVLEANGIITWRTLLNAKTLDAFSEFRVPHPVIVLSSEKANYFRSRMDAAHELGHAVMHRNVDRRALTKTSDFRLLEKQAHFFGSAFLLPPVSFEQDLWAKSLDAFRSLKPKWNVSIGLQIMRCQDLKLLSEEECKRLWINRSRRGWHKLEPLDDAFEPEQPNLIAEGFRMLVDARVRDREQIAKDLHLSAPDIENLAGLSAGFISGTAQETIPNFKPGSKNVVPFRR